MKNQQIEIREMTWFDLDQVMVIENENFSVPWTENGFFTYLMREDALFLVAEDEEGTIWGYIGVIIAVDEGDITNVSVKKEVQGQGIGTALIEELIRCMKEREVQTIFLEVRQSNAPAIALYEKMGFEKMGIRKNYYTDPTEDGITMSRKDFL